MGFYTAADRVKFWGLRGAFWGGLWGLFFGGLFLFVPVIGHVVVLGYIAATVISAAESAVVVGGLSAIGAALFGIGIPKDSVIRYEAAVKADRFLVMAHGTASEMARAKSVLGTTNPSSLDVHMGAHVNEPVAWWLQGHDRRVIAGCAERCRRQKTRGGMPERSAGLW